MKVLIPLPGNYEIFIDTKKPAVPAWSAWKPIDLNITKVMQSAIFTMFYVYYLVIMLGIN